MLRRTLARAAVSRTSLASQMSQRSFAVGVVKWFNDAKGIGFIQNEESGTDVFVHQSSIKSNTFRKLEEGERVKFDVENTEKGPAAKNVTREDGSPLDREARSFGGGQGGGRGGYGGGGRGGGGGGRGGGFGGGGGGDRERRPYAPRPRREEGGGGGGGGGGAGGGDAQ